MVPAQGVHKRHLCPDWLFSCTVFCIEQDFCYICLQCSSTSSLILPFPHLLQIWDDWKVTPCFTFFIQVMTWSDVKQTTPLVASRHRVQKILLICAPSPDRKYSSFGKFLRVSLHWFPKHSHVLLNVSKIERVTHFSMFLQARQGKSKSDSDHTYDPDRIRWQYSNMIFYVIPQALCHVLFQVAPWSSHKTIK